MEQNKGPRNKPMQVQDLNDKGLSKTYIRGETASFINGARKTGLPYINKRN